MEYLGNTEITSRSIRDKFEPDKDYWFRSRVTGNIFICTCICNCQDRTHHPHFKEPNIKVPVVPFDRFDVFGPIGEDRNPPDFDALIEANKAG